MDAPTTTMHTRLKVWRMLAALLALCLGSCSTSSDEDSQTRPAAVEEAPPQLAGLPGDVLSRIEGAARSAAAPPAAADGSTAHILVAYHSLSGNTERLAQAAAEGVNGVPGAVATVKKVEEVSKADLEAANGIVLGSPTYYANIPGKMKAAIDDWSWKMEVDFTDKVGGAFATGGGQTGGKEHVVISLLLFMINNRMVVAGPLYQDEEGEDFWAELGASAMTGPLDPGVGEQDLDGARRLGERVARLAIRLRKEKP